ncbi:hypothetical protein [Chitinophaga caseinilytica]|uniref:hypothetical protein n=1 Tax=Chitinophaga caseinilytica TaxID=2267521 RepID=UPI003C2D5BC2
MKNFLLFLGILTCLGFQQCKKDDAKEQDPYAGVPSSRVPTQLSGVLWFSGTLSAISYFDRDGHHLGNDYEAGREYQFQEKDGKGRMVFFQYLGLRTSSSCVTEHFTRLEGSVVFEGDLFTFYPVKGEYKTVKDKCSTGNGVTKRAAANDDLKPIKYRWEIKIIDGERLFYTYEEQDTAHEAALFVYRMTE